MMIIYLVKSETLFVRERDDFRLSVRVQLKESPRGSNAFIYERWICVE